MLEESTRALVVISQISVETLEHGHKMYLKSLYAFTQYAYVIFSKIYGKFTKLQALSANLLIRKVIHKIFHAG